jgi:hypothetical protein
MLLAAWSPVRKADDALDSLIAIPVKDKRSRCITWKFSRTISCDFSRCSQLKITGRGCETTKRRDIVGLGIFFLKRQHRISFNSKGATRQVS